MFYLLAQIKNKRESFERMETKGSSFVSASKKIREIPKDFPLLYWFIMKKIREARKDFPNVLEVKIASY